MPFDPTIALNVKTPIPESPLQTVGGLMQMRDQMSQIALRQASSQAEQARAADYQQQVEQRARDNQSWAKLQQLMRDPGNYSKVAQGDYSPVYDAGVTGSVANQAITNFNQQRTTAQGIEKSKLENYITQRGLLKDMLEGVDAEKDDAVSASQYNSGREALMNVVPDLAKNLPLLQPTQGYRDQLSNLINANGFHTEMLKDAADVAAKNAEAQQNLTRAQANTSEANLNAAKQPGAVAESTKQQLITTAMQNAQTAIKNGQHPIDAILGKLDPAAAAAYKPAYDSAMANGGPDAAKSILDAAAQHAGSITMATNPQVRAAEVSKAVQIAGATAPIEVSKAITVAKALRQGDNPAVAGVAPASIGQVQNDAIKLDQTYIKAKSVTDTMGHFLDLAQSGNKAAGANVPLVGVETLNAINGIKRINTAEISQYGSAGSLVDQIKGKLGKLAVGQPIPQDVLDDIREVHQVIGGQAWQEYTTGLNSLNQRTGAKYAPTVDPPNIRSGAGSPSNPGAPAPLPPLLSQKDVGQTYLNNKNQKLRITAVDPTNPKNFKFQVTQ